jgi:hypothetical protein
MWSIPTEQSADFVAKMEDILDIYERPYDERFPVICLDEKPKQLLGERREPMPMSSGEPKKVDNEYERNGTCSIFVMTEPLKGWIHANAREQRTAVDFAHETDWLVNHPRFANAEKITLVVDNLNTHVISSLYKAFPAQKARAIARKLDIHYTPKHGSWLNIAEIAISILSRQCINRRIPSLDLMNHEIDAWEKSFNENAKIINWQFTTDDARLKLTRIYPSFSLWRNTTANEK